MPDLGSTISLNASNFAAGVAQTRAKLVELNTALIENRNKMKEVNKEAQELQKQEKANTPVSDAQNTLGIKTVVTAPVTPATRKTHQHRVPKWYSALMTMGWKMPIIRKVQMPMSSPSKCKVMMSECF